MTLAAGGCECGSNTITNTIMSMKLQLQVGKRYVLRNGCITNPLTHDERSPLTPFTSYIAMINASLYWPYDGKWVTEQHDYDIISEYAEPQEGFEDLTEADHKAIDDYAAQGAEIDPYKVTLNGVLLDPYMIMHLYGINDPIIGQMLKKLLRNGRKHKTAVQDVVQSMTSGVRWLEINSPADAEQFKKGGAL